MRTIAYSICGLLLLLTPVRIQADEPRRIDDFGRTWVMCHPFTLMALAIRGEEVADTTYVDAGFNTMLAWKANDGLFESAVTHGIPWHQHTRKNPLSEQLKQRIAKYIETYPGGEAVLVWDEPARRDLPRVAEVVAWVKTTYPNQLVYSNADPGMPEQIDDEPYGYDDYLRELIGTGIDLLMIDVYPFLPGDGFRENYFERISAVRRAAREANIPYWIFVQAFSAEGNWRYPSESDLRMQVFSSLAFGYTGIAYFMFDHGYDGALLYSEDKDNGLGGVPTPTYYDVKHLNPEVKHVGECLRYLVSTGVWGVPGQHIVGDHLVENPLPSGLAKFVPGEHGSGLIRDIRVQGVGKADNILVGFFRDPIDAPYVMLANLGHGPEERAADRLVTLQLHLDPSLPSLGRLSRDTGEAELLAVRDGVLAVSLPGGTGDLFKLAPDTVFAGTGLTPRFRGTVGD